MLFFRHEIQRELNIYSDNIYMYIFINKRVLYVGTRFIFERFLIFYFYFIEWICIFCVLRVRYSNDKCTVKCTAYWLIGKGYGKNNI